MKEEGGRPERILDRIGDKSYEGRRALIEQLRKERTPRSVSLLLETLCDDSWSLRELALKALTETPGLSAPHLMTLLESGLWYTRAAAIRGLGLMAYAPALPIALRLLSDSNQSIAREAGLTLLALARSGRAVSVARGILATGERSEDGLTALETVDPDAGRKIRILAAREEIAIPVREWLSQDEPDPEVLEHELMGELDDTYGVRWEEISGPVSGA